MDLDTLIAQWSGKAPPGFVPPAVNRGKAPRCSQPRCKRPCAVKANGDFSVSCQPCLDRRAASCRRRRAALVAEGGCRRCAYRKRLEGDFTLPAVPRRARCRARAEAAGRHRRRRDRRVRRPARARPQGQQSGPRHIPVECAAQAATVGRILVAAAGPGAEVDPRVEALHQRQRLARESPLIRRFAVEARRLRSTRLGLPDALKGRLRRDAACQGRRVPSA